MLDPNWTLAAFFIVPTAMWGALIAHKELWKRYDARWRQWKNGEKTKLIGKIDAIKSRFADLRLAYDKLEADFKSVTRQLKVTSSALDALKKSRAADIAAARNEAERKYVAQVEHLSGELKSVSARYQQALAALKKMQQRSEQMPVAVVQEKVAQVVEQSAANEVSAHAEYQNPDPHPLNIYLGESAEGKKIYVGRDASYLAAGTKGWGKSNFLNSAIVQWVSNNKPNVFRMVGIDLKNGAELGFYDDMPHLLAPIAKDLQSAYEILQWLDAEGDRRQIELQARGKKKLDNYVEDGKPLPFPFIMVVIDELSMLTRSKMLTEEEKPIIKECQALFFRLVSLRRSAGILPMVATQSPDAQIIDTAMRNNFDARIAFRVPDHNASQTILGMSGAQKLSQKGECIFVYGASALTLQTPYVSNKQVSDAVIKAKQQYGSADYKLWNKRVIEEIPDVPLSRFGADEAFVLAAR
jgi:hypothetical protein